MLFNQKNSGFTLLEVLLVIGILAILATVSVGFYYNFFRSTQLSTQSKEVVFNLKKARANAMSSVDNRKWGIHFVNSTQDYYEIFSTPTDYSNPGKTIDETIYLTGIVAFSDPAESATKDIIFNKINGTVTVDSSVTISSNDGSTKIISVTAIGNIAE